MEMCPLTLTNSTKSLVDLITVGLIGQTMSEDETPMDETEKVMQINGRNQKMWELPASSSPSAVGDKLMILMMANPQQIFRVFRADEMIFIAAIEGEEWSKV